MTTEPGERPGRARAMPALIAFVIDAGFVVVFAAIGRASHDENVLAGLWTTAWPFLLALAVGWLATLGWRAPLALVRTALPLWVVTVVGGMLLRAASGQGVQVAFVIVAAVVLGLMLVGWRALVMLVRSARLSRSTRTPR